LTLTHGMPFLEKGKCRSIATIQHRCYRLVLQPFFFAANQS
jgi:hypothetical protein